MKNAYLFVAGLATTLACTSVTSFGADAAAEEGLVEAPARGRWSFSAGPAWRSRVKIDTHGSMSSATPVSRQTIKRDMNDSANWDRQGKVADPNAGTGGIPDDGQLWGVTDTRTEIYGYRGSGYSVSNTDEERPLGLNLQGCCDFYQGETWSVGLNLRFSGYWNMKSSTGGRFADSITQTDVYTDQYVFEDSDTDQAFDDTVSPLGSKATYAGETLDSHTLDYGQTRGVSTRFRGDLYQIGLGPKVTWTPFAGVCDAMDWLDVYGGVEVLCNLAHSRFSADGSSTSQTDCLVGFGGNVGLVGNVTDWCGVYGQVGYEWVDKSDISTSGFSADIDYSSLVLSAGVQFRF